MAKRIKQRINAGFVRQRSSDSAPVTNVQILNYARHLSDEILGELEPGTLPSGRGIITTLQAILAKIKRK